jgi:hypothetical protein
MIHPRYHEAFCTLNAEQLSCCLAGLRTARNTIPEITDPEEFLGYCISEHISQAEIVMSLAHQHTVAAVSATEHLIMKPIDRRTATEVERERQLLTPRAIAAPVSAREATTDTRLIRVLADRNPKRPGTAAHDRFALYVDGMTVAEFLRAGGTRGDLQWDQERCFIRLAPADEVLQVPDQQAA